MIFSIYFRAGSIITSYTVEIDDNASSPVTADGVVEALTNAVNSGLFGNLQIDTASLTAEGQCFILSFFVPFFFLSFFLTFFFLSFFLFFYFLSFFLSARNLLMSHKMNEIIFSV